MNDRQSPSHKRRPKPLILLLAWLTLCSPAHVAATEIVVLDFELRDLTLNPRIEEETARARQLRSQLAQRLINHHGLDVLEPPASAEAEADKGEGYLFEHPEIAAQLGREIGGDWIVSGRLHKASFLFIYLKVQLIDANSGKVSADLVVEVKGTQPKLMAKGVEALAQQVADSLDKLSTQQH